jgi:saposin
MAKAVLLLVVAAAALLAGVAARPITAPAPVGNNNLCSLCEFAVHMVDDKLNENATEAEIIHAVENVCSHLPATVAGPCKLLIDTYGDQIIQALVARLGDANGVCIAVHLCPQAARQGPLGSALRVGIVIDDKPAPQEPLVAPRDSQCALCEFVVSELDQLLENNATEADIIAALENVCNALPASVHAECETLIQQYGPQLYLALLSKLNATQICTVIGLCTNQAEKNYLAVTAAHVRAGQLCPICEFVLKEVDNLLAENATEAEVLTALAKVCSILPKAVQSECATLINEYGQAIYLALLNKLDPQQVCTAIGLCTNSPAPVVVESPVAAVESTECVLCEFVIKEVDSLLGANATEAEVLAALAKVCSVIPKSLQPECQALIQSYGPQIYQLLINKLDPQQVCTAIGLCNSTTTVSKMSDAEMTVSVTGGTECAICEFVLKEVDNLLGSNATEQDVLAALVKVCSVLPKSIQGECQTLIQSYGPIIFQMLVNKVDPQQICTAIGLCTGTLKVSKPVAGTECVLCEFVLKEVDALLGANATEAQVLAALAKVCSILPKSLQAECQTLIETYGPQIYQLLINKVDPQQICTAIGLCNSTAIVAPMSDAMSVTGGAECALCEFVLKEVDSLLGNNATESEVLTALAKVCSILPKSLQAECQALIQSYGPQIYQLLINKVDPQQICTTIGLCTSGNAEEAKRLLEKMMQPTPTVHLKTVSVQGGAECAICEFVLKEVDNLLGNNATEAEVLTALAKVCSILPKSIQGECVNLINQYGPEIFQLLINKVDPQQICTTIGLCTGLTSLNKQVEGGAECAICEFVLKEVDSLLGANATEAEVLTALAKVCSILPKSIQGECVNLINQYGPQIYQLLINKVDPQQICTAIGLCTSAGPRAFSQPENVQGGAECAICEFVLKEVDSLLGANATEAEVLTALAKVCSILPKSIQGECVNLINQYGPQIYQLLINKVDPQQICTAIGLCTSELIEQSAEVEAGTACVLCEFVLKEVDSLLTDNATETEVLTALAKVCSIIPKSLQPECQALIQSYGPQIYQMLINKVDPQQICTAIGLCTSAAKVETKPAVVGGVIECAVCELIIKELSHLVNSNSTQQEILNALDKVCSLLPSKLESDCENIVNTYGPALFQAIISGAGSTVCKTTGLCAVPPPATKPLLAAVTGKKIVIN